MDHSYTQAIPTVFQTLSTSHKGLTNQEAAKRLTTYGPNELPKEQQTTLAGIFLRQFRSPLLLLLLFAGALSLALGETLEAAAIAAILLLNAILGCIQEYRAEQALAALEKLSAPTARVIRQGTANTVAARTLVPGDIILLEQGNIVAADARLTEVFSLTIDEAALTGESMPSAKFTHPLKAGTSVADQENMAFMGTKVTYGKGRAVVTATGHATQFGHIAASLQATPETPTPLQKKFSALARQIGMVALILILAVFLTGLIRHTFPFTTLLLFALALTVSTVPNSLPVIVTASLSIGSRRLASKNMLIKRLPSAESLGAVTIICCDKTGTITNNQMTATRVYCSHTLFDVTGSGYDITGSIMPRQHQHTHPDLETVYRIGCLCNNASLEIEQRIAKTHGDPMEVALLILGKKAGIEKRRYHQGFIPAHELPFDAQRKMMTTVYKIRGTNKAEAVTKGAPENVIKACTKILDHGKIRGITAKDQQRIRKAHTAMAKQALRVLALAYRPVSPTAKLHPKTLEKQLIFAGLVGFIDPPRDGVAASIRRCAKAGIRVMLISGDHPLTTKAIAQQIGLYKRGDHLLTGTDIDQLNDAQLKQAISKASIIARALPIHKCRIITALQEQGHVVAMTGDGVNDAPALKRADIGVAMGRQGTDVARQASGTVLLDDNFSTIVNGIEEGRSIYDKMITSARYLLSCNAGEICSVLFALLLSLPTPLLPLQLLLMNILTDDLPALGLGGEPTEDGIMKRPPRNPREHPITTRILLSILLFGILMGIATVSMFTLNLSQGLPKAQTIAFTTLVLFQMFAVISSRSLTKPFTSLNPLTNPWLSGGVLLSILLQVAVVYLPPLQTIFGTTSLGLMDWARIVGVSSMGFVMMEAGKYLLSQQPPDSTLR